MALDCTAVHCMLQLSGKDLTSVLMPGGFWWSVKCPAQPSEHARALDNVAFIWQDYFKGPVYESNWHPLVVCRSYCLRVLPKCSARRYQFLSWWQNHLQALGKMSESLKSESRLYSIKLFRFQPTMLSRESQRLEKTFLFSLQFFQDFGGRGGEESEQPKFLPFLCV